jgi:hypothetical protein
MSFSDPKTKARERVERHQIADARAFGGRRIGFLSDQERASMVDMEAKLLEAARRVVRQNR